MEQPKKKQRRRRSKEDKAMRRAEILSLATMAFIEGGYSAVKMRDIAANLGTTAASLYTYFRTKNDILKAIVNDGLTMLQERVNRINPNQSLRGCIKDIAIEYYNFAQKYPHLYNLLYRKEKEITFLEDETRLSFLILKFKMQEALRLHGIVTPLELWEIRDKMSGALWSAIHGTIVLNFDILKQYTPTLDQLLYPVNILMEGWAKEYSFFND